ncbi:MAG: hypothetical protein PWR27_1860 [Petroclostridium sp.]|jgi:spore coat protein CotF|uniref:spore coat protein n=1 Tax=Petroclostridium xylanilyticum TaxID=1792311 RepID=UPI000B981B10|nr:spore coat protein [Petroclostridium xylanilyticum]MBZ4645414.1 Coat domain protein [Clostridia bacterium]MDK2811151.1 hypothetical protein [Petroclostridium sp.]
MQERDMVNDVLSMLNSSIVGYSNVLVQAGNEQLRQTIAQLRAGDETFQYNLYKIAEQKGYYKPAAPADQTDIMQVKNQFVG